MWLSLQISGDEVVFSFIPLPELQPGQHLVEVPLLVALPPGVRIHDDIEIVVEITIGVILVTLGLGAEKRHAPLHV